MRGPHVCLRPYFRIAVTPNWSVESALQDGPTYEKEMMR